jgi:uncharacterized protein
VIPVGIMGGLLTRSGAVDGGPLRLRLDRVEDDAAPGHWLGKSGRVLCRQRRYVDSRWRQLGSNGWPIIVGLMIGGALAAPFAAFMARKLPQRALMLLVATAVVLLSLRGLR